MSVAPETKEMERAEGDKASSMPPPGKDMKRDAPYKGKFMCCGDPEARPNQPGCVDFGICAHKGTKHYPAYHGMLDAADVSGVYQDPDCKCFSLNVKGVPAVGCLCMIAQCFGCPYCCYCAPFHCCPWPNCIGNSCKCSCGGCGRGGPKAAPCLPDSLTLAGTWFCAGGGEQCIDFYDNDTMLTSWMLCCCPQIWRKTKQGSIIC